MFEQAELPQRRSAERQWFKVTGPRRFQRFNFLALSERISSYWVHFDPATSRTRPCTGPGKCAFCNVHMSRRWQGYIAGASLDTRQRMVVEITEGAARKMQAKELLKKSLRGYSFTLYRKMESGKVNGAVYVDFTEPTKGKPLPPDFDILPSLLRLWGVDDEDNDGAAVGKPSPMQPSGGPRTLVTGEVPY